MATSWLYRWRTRSTQLVHSSSETFIDFQTNSTSPRYSFRGIMTDIHALLEQFNKHNGRGNMIAANQTMVQIIEAIVETMIQSQPCKCACELKSKEGDEPPKRGPGRPRKHPLPTEPHPLPT